MENKSRRSANRKTAEEAIRFLDTNMLDSTPSNYRFAYLYVTGVDSGLRKAVNAIISDGVRLSQQDIDDLSGASTTGAAAAMPSLAEDQAAQLRHQALAFGELAAATLRDTGAFNRDLTQGVEAIGSGADLLTIMQAMIVKTAEVERKLAETTRETERLRFDLEAARDDATRDALTNLPNRRAVDREMQTLIAQGTRITIAFCDVDHFKLVNDRFGHAVGDRVLKAVAETLQDILRPHTVARFGGEEFVAILTDVDVDQAFALVEKAREAVSERNFRVRDTDEMIGQVTFSAGIATTTCDPSEALREADHSLYEAKNSGRNRTICKGGMREAA
ncbi:GGDEF domain-containing protein [Sphingobium sufflavum]|uniref:GGDEF domain-containing protein n=1 Tax=Sphingobium sufflavum TaxID=1129547 RepID=UPI001F1BC8D1|nr:GGDEF domain-containing protein [Sphingobium sufflavum]MCE7794946.1 GGDEF domain-containing protein [Sphingobium sufflavum]